MDAASVHAPAAGFGGEVPVVPSSKYSTHEAMDPMKRAARPPRMRPFLRPPIVAQSPASWLALRPSSSSSSCPSPSAGSARSCWSSSSAAAGSRPCGLAREVYGAAELRTVAVKLFPVGGLRDRRGARVIDEARALCRVEHPNVVRFYALPIDEARGVIGLAMEHVAGARPRSLDRGARPSRRGRGALRRDRDRVRARRRPPRGPRAPRRQARERDRGGRRLQAHRLRDRRGGGGAREGARQGRAPRPARGRGALARDDARRHRDTADLPLGVACGTVGYIDPACLAGGERATAASDLYALGALLFECLAGRLPAAMGDGRGLRGEVLDGRARPPPLCEVAPDVAPSIGRIVDALLSPRREDRPRSAEWVAIRLDRIHAELAGAARPLPPETVGPFRGLGRYREGDRDLYFGRAGEIGAVLEVLRGHGLAAIVGPSGSGKSSLARAGVLPAITDGALGGWPAAWDVAVVEPGPIRVPPSRRRSRRSCPARRISTPRRSSWRLAERTSAEGAGSCSSSISSRSSRRSPGQRGGPSRPRSSRSSPSTRCRASARSSRCGAICSIRCSGSRASAPR